MKTYIIRLALLCILVLTAFSCSSDSEESGVSGRLSKRTYDNLDAPDGPATYKYTYTGDLLNEIKLTNGNYVQSSEFVYQGQTLQSIELYNNGTFDSNVQYQYLGNLIVESAFTAGGYDYRREYS